MAEQRLIDANAFKENMFKYAAPEMVWDMADIIHKIDEMPSAQQERKKGKWIKISPAGIYECSVCGQNVMTQDIDAYLYCHGCGADMRGTP